MRIAIDAMGGDFAPQEIVAGALEAARADAGTHILLVGDESAMRALLPTSLPSNLELVPSTQVVGMDESPSHALRGKKESSLAIATRLHAEGKADACLSAGNTGAASAFALFTLGRIEGIDRPGIATVFPTATTPCVVMDVGANVDCKPRHLADFALMGAAYAPAIRDIIPGEAARRAKAGKKITVGLLSIGEEDSKGNELVKASREGIATAAPRGNFEFVGNVEGRDIPKGTVDVIVCDGFVGNVVLKLAEGFAGLFLGGLKEALMSSPRSKLGAMLMAPALRRMRTRFDHSNFGGAALLGVKGNCIICHGSAKAKAITSAIRVAKLVVEAKVPEAIALAAKPTE
ncbi:phosphate acyltransferase PlsX [bacterium]|nr:MAG: phosphate acyltransferase PlsX [bacterium]